MNQHWMLTFLFAFFLASGCAHISALTAYGEMERIISQRTFEVSIPVSTETLSCKETDYGDFSTLRWPGIRDVASLNDKHHHLSSGGWKEKCKWIDPILEEAVRQGGSIRTTASVTLKEMITSFKQSKYPCVRYLMEKVEIPLVGHTYASYQYLTLEILPESHCPDQER
ncbi:MAG: hypothetical protein HY391_04445 [Deltaproteobacteria bacterium]|nr:hypothetical protein [Deltaproteobacteria bacterium]